MLTVLPLPNELVRIVNKHGLRRKFRKQCELISRNWRHPSLRVERLEPKEVGLCSFRIDRKYRAIFFFREDEEAIEIVDVTVHYQ